MPTYADSSFFSTARLLRSEKILAVGVVSQEHYVLGSRKRGVGFARGISSKSGRRAGVCGEEAEIRLQSKEGVEIP